MIYLDEERLLNLLRDPHPRVRENAVKLTEVRLAKSPVLQDRLVAMAGDAYPRVRCQISLTLGAWDSSRIVAPLAEIALAGADDSWTRLAVASALLSPADEENHKPPISRALPVLQAIVQAPQFRKLPAAQQSPLLQEFAALTAAEPVGLQLAALAQELGDDRLQLALLNGFADGLARKSARLDEYFFKSAPNPNDPVVKWLREFIQHEGQTAADPKAG